MQEIQETRDRILIAKQKLLEAQSVLAPIDCREGLELTDLKMLVMLCALIENKVKCLQRHCYD